MGVWAIYIFAVTVYDNSQVMQIHVALSKPLSTALVSSHITR